MNEAVTKYYDIETHFTSLLINIRHMRFDVFNSKKWQWQSFAIVFLNYEITVSVLCSRLYNAPTFLFEVFRIMMFEMEQL